MKTIPALVFTAVTCLGLPHFTQGQALPFQQGPPPGTPVPVTPPPPADSAGTTTTTSTTATTSVPDGFIMKDGNVFMVKNGVLTPVTQEQVLRISPKGTVTGFDGTTWQIPAGQMLTSDGRMVAVDPSLMSTTQPVRADANVAGENISGLAPSRNAAPAASGSSSSTQSSSSDAFSQVPDTRGKRSTGSMRGGGTSTLDQFGNVIVIDRPVPPGEQGTQPQPIIPPGNGSSGTIDRRFQSNTGTTGTNTNTTGTTTDRAATPNQRFSTGTTTDPNATGASRDATPNQLNSSGTNTGPNARTTTPRPTTPNQENSSGTNTTNTGTSATSTSGSTTTNPNAVRTGTGSTGATSTTAPSASGTSSTTGTRSTTSGGTTSPSGGGSTSGSSGSAGGSSGGAAPR